MRLGLLLVLAASALPIGAGAQQATVTTVLGLSTDEADDVQVAENLTAVLRRAVEEAPSLRVSDREATLAQMSLAFGCELPPNPDCLEQIGHDVGSAYLVFGTLSRVERGSDYGFRAELHLFDVEAGSELRGSVMDFARTARDWEDLRPIARRMVGELVGTETGHLEIRADVEGASVRIDGEPVGEIEDGSFSAPDITVGEHRVEVEAAGHDPASVVTTVHADHTAIVRVSLLPSNGGAPEPEASDGASWRWLGVGSLTAGALLAGFAAFSAIMIGATNGDPDWDEVRHRAGDAGLDGVCNDSELSTASYSRSEIDLRCSLRSSTLQWVMGGAGVALGALGTVLILRFAEDGESTGSTEHALRLQPIVGPSVSGLDLSGQF